MLKNKMPMQFSELDRLCPIELMLISQIIPFMFIFSKRKGTQCGLKGQCVLVPTNLKEIQTILPRYLISLALKRWLTDASVFNKQQIRYSNITIDNEWKDFNEESDPVLGKLLTDNNVWDFNNSDQIDNDDDIEGKDKFKERELKESSALFLIVVYSIDRPSISPSEIVNIAFLFLSLWNLIGKYLHFFKTAPQEETTLMRKEKFH